MIGRKSFYITKTINGTVVYIQANKNYGICDVIIKNSMTMPIPPTGGKKAEWIEKKKLYEAKKAEYDAHVAKLKDLRQTVLNAMQGRQITDPYNVEAIANFLMSTL